ncbi:hypothetical protein RAD15_12630 [Bradyrhizobium sp. 14AA]
MLLTTIATILALYAAPAPQADGSVGVIEVQYGGVPRYPPPCGRGWDISARDGMCYPGGYLPPQEQSARRYRPRYVQPEYYGEPEGYRHYGGRYPVPCGDGADIDYRDGRCYPTGTVPRQFQNRSDDFYRRY